MNHPVSELVAQLAASDGPTRTRAAGRLMTAVVERPETAAELVVTLQAEELPRPAYVVGFTGAPGAGKSTLADAVVSQLLRRSANLRIAVVAVDPTSPFTGGAVLGDRVRMMHLALEERVFIRSLATRGELGGVCRALPSVLGVAALWGADVAIVETVGVGQSEIEIARHADRTCVVMAPGNGDGVQWLKAGLMEAADYFVVNKSDRDGAASLAGQLQSACERQARAPRRRLRPERGDLAAPPQIPPVLTVSAELGTGIDALIEALHLHELPHFARAVHA